MAASLCGEGDDTEQGDRVLRAVFDNSRRLGLSLARHLGVTFELQDFQELLRAIGSPCHRGNWTRRDRARILERTGCGFAPEAGSRACDYWRESLDGLVMGLGDRERVVRHACARRGDSSCVDVLFLECDAAGGDSPAWAPVPDGMALDLFEAAEYFRRKTGIGVEIKGINEGVLHFRFKESTDGRCSSGAASMGLFGELVHERFPELRLRDITPQAVLSESGSGG